jgi:hypothetical protein
MVFLFVGPLAAHEADLASRIALDLEWEVRAAPRTLAELERLAAWVAKSWDLLRAEGIMVVGSGVDEASNDVGIAVANLTPAQADRLQAIFGAWVKPIGTPWAPTGGAPTPTARPVTVVQLARDEDWRLVAERDHALEVGIIVATSPTQLKGPAWDDVDLGHLGHVDWERELVTAYIVLVEYNCPDRDLTGIELDTETGAVYPTYVRPPGSDPNDCFEIGGSHTFVVVLARSALPDGKVVFRLQRESGPEDVVVSN